MKLNVPKSVGHATETILLSSNSDHRRLWSDYISSTGKNALFFRAEWDSVLSVYRLPVLRVIALRQDKVVGALPMVWQKSPIFGNRLISLPWFDAAGIVADDEEARQTLIQRAFNESSRRRIWEIHIRQRDPLETSGQLRLDKVLLRLALDRDTASLWKGFKPEVRNQVRKARKAGLTVTRGRNEMLPDFYAVYSENMRDLGSPSHSRAFFEAILAAFPNETHIYLVKLKDQTIGAGWTMRNGTCLEIPWASSLRRYNSYCVNHIMYWQIIDDASREGFRWFHFGRSTRDTGPYRFKLQWGAEPVQLYWYHWIPKAPSAAEDNCEEKGTPSAYEYGALVWRRLPLWLTRKMGPRLIRSLP